MTDCARAEMDLTVDPGAMPPFFSSSLTTICLGHIGCNHDRSKELVIRQAHSKLPKVVWPRGAGDVTTICTVARCEPASKCVLSANVLHYVLQMGRTTTACVGACSQATTRWDLRMKLGLFHASLFLAVFGKTIHACYMCIYS